MTQAADPSGPVLPAVGGKRVARGSPASKLLDLPGMPRQPWYDQQGGWGQAELITESEYPRDLRQGLRHDIVDGEQDTQTRDGCAHRGARAARTISPLQVSMVLAFSRSAASRARSERV